MFDLLFFVLLTAPLLGLVLTGLVNSSNDPIFVCGNVHPTRPDPADCDFLLRILETLSWTRIPVRYGRVQNYPGTTPLFLTDGTCRFEIRAYNQQDYRSDVFELRDSFNVIQYIRSNCITLRTGGYSMGTAGIGHHPFKFYAYLGAVPDPPEDRMGNSTVLSLGG